MKNLFQKETHTELLERLNKLSPDSPRGWGKMNVSQMLAHCSIAMEVAVGRQFPKRLFIGRILRPFILKAFTDGKPFTQGLPTDPTYVVADEKDFEKEKERLRNLLIAFHEGAEAKCTKHPHPFFGNLKPTDWANGMYKHNDHHLRQFGV